VSNDSKSLYNTTRLNILVAKTNVKFFIILLLVSIFVIGCQKTDKIYLNQTGKNITKTEEINFDKLISEKYGTLPGSCSKPVFCNNIAEVDCDSAVDGPLYYFERDTGKEISICGGYCMDADPERTAYCQTMCPPKEWICN